MIGTCSYMLLKSSLLMNEPLYFCSAVDAEFSREAMSGMEALIYMLERINGVLSPPRTVSGATVYA